MEKFNEMALPEALLQTLEDIGFQKPTLIQAQTIPMSLKGKDVLGTAQTGTGKTGAFAIPMAAKLLNNEDESVIVMTPTRELASQVSKVFGQLLPKDKSIKTALLIGGENIQKQLKQLKARPRLIVGTPGRINDHLQRGTLSLRTTRSLILDEMDRMLDMGFDVQIAKIIGKMPAERQTLMFSATLPKKIEGLASKYLVNPERVTVGQESTPGKDIEQNVALVSVPEKYDHLLDQLNTREGSVILFVKTKRGADRLATKLTAAGHESAAIHGDLKQSKRERVLSDFRRKKFRILVATDVAARGIDVPHIRHVINYDLPQCPEDYIHRIGRTARAGEKGEALSFVTPQDRSLWAAIERLLDPNAKSEPFRRERRPSRGGDRQDRPRRDRSPASRDSGQDRPWKDRRASADGAETKDRPWKDRRPSADGAEKKDRPWKARSDSAASGERKDRPWKDRAALSNGGERQDRARKDTRSTTGPKTGFKAKSFTKGPRKGPRPAA